MLALDCTKCVVQGHSKKRTLELISELAAQHLSGFTPKELFDSLLCREKLGSTGIGNGIALPHGRLPSGSSPIAVLLKCEEPIEFDAIDKRPVDLVFALLVPEQSCELHLKTLASVASKLSDKNTLKQLRAAVSDEALYQAMIDA